MLADHDEAAEGELDVQPCAQVFQGIMLASLDRFQKDSPLGAPLPAFGGRVTSPAGYLAALWAHECGRVFCDKMITNEDKAWVDGAIRDLSKRALRSLFAVLLQRSMRACPKLARSHRQSCRRAWLHGRRLALPGRGSARRRPRGTGSTFLRVWCGSWRSRCSLWTSCVSR